MGFNYVLMLSFVGTHFHGWQIQPGLRTVQGELKKATETLFKEEVKLTGCCRTDAGVHAKEYVANFTASARIEEERLLRALNGILPADIGVKKVWIEEGFNARYSVKGKVYTYRILNSYAKDPFLEPFCVRIPQTLDILSMEKACELFLGKHDFSGFAKLEEDKNTVIEIQEISLRRDGELIEISVKASHFLRYMVRRIVGSLIYLGLGKIKEEDIKDYLLNKKKCPHTAKAKGLTLERVIL
ncbi:MAG: tRNA pseudouridine(38-40) synthase TruA [Aquificota bacterium]|nr:MAG: tRNA pseudouridine(38-40) synthase TruA [Aquificota bacterium]